MTGKTIWTTKELSDEAGYASAIVVDVHGVRAYTTFTSAAAVGVRASDGKLMWRYAEPPPTNVANITTPVVQDNRIFYTSAYGTGGGLVTLQAKDGELTAQETISRATCRTITAASCWSTARSTDSATRF